MTVRSILLGLLGAAFICAFSYFHDHIIAQWPALVPNLMPPVVYGALVLFVMLVNPFLRWLRARVLSAGELAVVAGLGLVACSIPSWGLIEFVPSNAIMTHYYVRNDPAWQGSPVLIESGDVRGWPELRTAMKGAADRPEQSALAAAEGRLSPDLRTALFADGNEPALRPKITDAVNALLKDRMLGEETAEPGPLPPYVERLHRRAAEALSDAEVKVLNRGLLDAWLKKGLEPVRIPRSEAAGAPDVRAQIEERDVLDWLELHNGLENAPNQPEQKALAAAVDRLPKELRAALSAEASDPVSRSKVLEALNAILADRRLGEEARDPGGLPPHAAELRRRAAAALSDAEVQVLNRGLLDAWFPAALKPRVPNPVEVAPTSMMVEVTRNDEDLVLGGYKKGLAEGTAHISLGQIPWYAWKRTLMFWLPLILSMMAAFVGLALVVHGQWARNEQLAYPISVFAHSLVPEPGQARGSVFANRWFWVAALIVLGIKINNYLWAWWPEFLIPVNLKFNFTALAKLMPPWKDQPWMMLHEVRFMVIGLAYFLPSNVSLSVGLVPYIYTYVMYVFAQYGVTMAGGEHLGQNYNTFLFAGGYFGIFLMLLYTGRHYYWNALKGSLLPLRSEAHAGAVWGMRMFLVGAGLFILQLTLVGLDWQLAVLFTFVAIMTHTVVSRIIAETGAFFIGTYFVPGALLTGFLGATAIGPKAMMIMTLVSGVFMLAPAWATMPFAVQAFKLMDMSKVRVSRASGWLMAAIVLGIAVALSVTLYWQYDRGLPDQGWPTYGSAFPGRDTVLIQRKLQAQGSLELADSLHGWERFRLQYLSLDAPRVTAFVITASLVLIVGFCHLRFSWWPFHPVMFVFLGSGHGQMISLSLLLGWAVKAGVNKYGGARLYHRLKPVMIGLIAGDVVARFIPMAVGTVYFMFTGQTPVSGGL